jgi:putative ABC transport system substrate-binding protein
MGGVSRRKFLVAAGAVLAAPLAGQAQQARTVPMVGILHDRPAGPSGIIRDLQEELRKLGYVEGQTINLEIRLSGGRREDLPNLARELAQRRVDVIYAVGPAPLKAARDATGTIPIVGVAFEIDPVAAGYARSVAQPGGNVTGVFLDQPALTAKWLQFIRAVIPGVSRIALLRDPTTGPGQLAAVNVVSQQLGMQLQVLEAQYATDFDEVIRSATQAGLEPSCSSHHL